MTKPSVKADAFQLALLRSERLRILIVIGVALTILAVRVARTLYLLSSDSLRLTLVACVLGAIFIGI
jgi:hypothetical protein